MVRHRSRRAEIAVTRAELRREGWSYKQIAAHLRQAYGFGPLAAFRHARGLSQEQVASELNRIQPDVSRTITGQHISYWESWPRGSGRRPSITELALLARVYMCEARDLVDSEDYSHLDDNHVSQASPLVDLADAVNFPTSLGVGEATILMETLAASFAPGTNLVRDASPHVGVRESDYAYDRLIRTLLAWAGSEMKRREILRIFGWAAASVAASPSGLESQEGQERTALVLTGQHRIDGEVISNIEEVLWRCMRQDDALGPHAVLDITLAQRNLAASLIHDCPDPLRPRFLSLWSNISRFAGWLSFDLGAYRDAEYLYEDAREKAHAGRNTQLGVMVLCNLSHLATWTNRARAVASTMPSQPRGGLGTWATRSCAATLPTSPRAHMPWTVSMSHVNAS